MKARAWQRFLDEQQRLHGKRIFTLTELASVSGASRAVAKVEVGRLVRQGVMARFARDRYGLPAAVDPETLLPHLDGLAYITGLYALHRHGLITQVPSEIVCFTLRRHNRSRVRETPAGRFVFVCVSARLYDPPSGGVLAGPEQALCDSIYLTRRQGLALETLVTFRELTRLNAEALARRLTRYPRPVAHTLRRLPRK